MLAVHEQLPGLRRQLEAARKAKAAEQVKKLEQDIDMLEKKEAKFKDTGKVHILISHNILHLIPFPELRLYAVCCLTYTFLLYKYQ